MRVGFGLCFVVATWLSGGIGHAGSVQTFFSRGDFTANADRFVTETFNSARADRPFSGAGLRFDGFSVQHEGSLGSPFNTLDVQPAVDPVASIDGSPFLYAGLRNGETLSFVFDEPVNSFAADFAGVDDNQTRGLLVSIEGEDGVSHDISQLVSFLGLISDIEFDKVIIAGHNQADLGFGIDNLSFGQTAVVPLPASLPMLLAGLAGLGVLCWRLRRS